MPRARSFLPCLLLIVSVACTGTTTTTTAPPPTTVAAPPGSGVDPLVPYSPAPTPHATSTTGYIPDTLTAPTGDGGSIQLTPVTTTMTTTYVHQTRALTFYVTATNPGKSDWRGTIGTDAQVTDVNGATFPASRPAPGDLHPDPAQYSGSNRSFRRPVSIASGASVRGALVFHVTGGNRPITLRISLDGGTTWVEWATNLGTF